MQRSGLTKLSFFRLRPSVRNTAVPLCEQQAYLHSSYRVFAPMKTSEISDPAVAEIAQYVNSVGGKLPLASIISSIGAKSKDTMFRSGKGVEGFVKSGFPAINVVEENGMKYIKSNVIVDVAAAEPVPPIAPAIKEPQPVRTTASSKLLPPNIGIESPMTAVELHRLELHAVAVCYNTFGSINEAHQVCKVKCSYDDFTQYLKACGQFWVNGTTMRIKKAGETVMPANFRPVVPEQSKVQAVVTKEDRPKRLSTVTHQTMMAPCLANNYGGWGSASGVPTAEDVYEILKYVPVHWGNMGALNLPAPIKKKHIRIASFLQWLRRQPKYFEIRNIAGTLEVRRAVPLHPEQHGKSQEEADQWLADRIASGEHNSITGSGDVGTNSIAATAIYKFLIRVTPGYFVAPELLFMRYTKKGLTPSELSQIVKEHPTLFETVTLVGGNVLIRRRTGADSGKWRDEFVADCNSVATDVNGLFHLMGRSSVCWDRPEYLYVRLLDKEKLDVGGYNGMLALMNRHPLVFRMGETFFKRLDHSDPSSLDEPEPTGKEVQLFKKVEENVYHGHRDIATVFHYVSPDDTVVNVAQLSDCASPAIQAELPPRIVSILQMFPDLFNCKETAPGVFSIRKITQRTGAQAMRPVQFGSGFFHATGTDGRAVGGVQQSQADSTMDDMLMGDDDSDIMTRRETVEAVRGLIPSKGVDRDQLSQWLSMALKKNVATHYETLPSLLNANLDKFSVDSSNLVTAK